MAELCPNFVQGDLMLESYDHMIDSDDNWLP